MCMPAHTTAVNRCSAVAPIESRTRRECECFACASNNVTILVYYACVSVVVSADVSHVVPHLYALTADRATVLVANNRQ